MDGSNSLNLSVSTDYQVQFLLSLMLTPSNLLTNYYDDVLSCSCNSDVIMGSTFMQPSRYIKQLLSTIKSMNEMRLPAEFVSFNVQ